MDWLKAQFELSRGGSRDNLRTMEGMRGFAVFLVFLTHYVSLSDPWLPLHSATTSFAHGLHSIGNAGVDLFFVLSGYVIYGSLINRPQSFLAFMKRRVRRIYPVFSVILAIYVALSFAVPSENKIPIPFVMEGMQYILFNFLLLPGIFPITPLITVAWSLSYEIFYYLTIPLFVWACGLRNRSPLWRVRFFLLLAALGVGILGNHIRLVMFIAGILVYDAGKHKLTKLPNHWMAWSSLILGLTTMLLPLNGAAGFAIKICVLFLAFFVLCLSCFSAPDSSLARFFSWTPMRWLGNMSYSYYLIHGLTLKACFMSLEKLGFPVGWDGQALFWLLLVPLFLATLVPASALFLGIERPLSLKTTSSGGSGSGRLSTTSAH